MFFFFIKRGLKHFWALLAFEAQNIFGSSGRKFYTHNVGVQDPMTPPIDSPLNMNPRKNKRSIKQERLCFLGISKR